MTLESPGAVELDTSVVVDVLGLRARYQKARPTQGAAREGQKQCLCVNTRRRHPGD